MTLASAKSVTPTTDVPPGGKPLFDKILIANRGEIACRVIKSAQRLGIATVAIYSEADAQALHVQMADEAICIGPPPAAQSYIDLDRVMAAVRDSGADAVHPGYGFLSERAAFAGALSEAGVAFIGPPVGAIEAMGDKITSKKLASEAGVSTVPGFMGIIDDADTAVRIAADIGYPVMIKASAGGGGKGMRIAWNEAEAREGFQSSKNEALASFGDDRLFIERFVTQPRHIEIQVLGDTQGNCVYLGERECSIQRRNQKVIEEAPSPFLDAATRAAMGEQAVALARAVNYCSAGTVEFIVDGDRNFYFLEMNTRLQVEHPVTELITGIDLVEQMIRVAAGLPLSMAQSDIVLNGWAVESRLYAEDPYRGFLPSIGRLSRYRPPAEVTGDTLAVRNDTGVYEGGEISLYYDPMIAKLCTWAPDRSQAIEAMRGALDAFELEGIGHNLPFLSAVMDHPRFIDGNITTAFIEEEYPDGFKGVTPDEATARRLAAAAVTMHQVVMRRSQRISGRLEGTPRPPRERWVASIAGVGAWPLSAHALATAHVRTEEGQEIGFVARPDDGLTEPLPRAREGMVDVRFDDGEILRVDSDWTPGQRLTHTTINRQPMAFKIEPQPEGFRLRHAGCDVVVAVRSPWAHELADLMPDKIEADTSRQLLCPMPGLVVSIDVAEGDAVQAGQTLAVIEAMKMENVLRAERAGTVSVVHASAGASLAVDDVIMEFE